MKWVVIPVPMPPCGCSWPNAVNNIYQWLIIPATLGGFMLYIGLDVRKRWSDNRKTMRQAVALAEKELENELGDDDFTQES